MEKYDERVAHIDILVISIFVRMATQACPPPPLMMAIRMTTLGDEGFYDHDASPIDDREQQISNPNRNNEGKDTPSSRQGKERADNHALTVFQQSEIKAIAAEDVTVIPESLYRTMEEIREYANYSLAFEAYGRRAVFQITGLIHEFSHWADKNSSAFIRLLEQYEIGTRKNRDRELQIVKLVLKSSGSALPTSTENNWAMYLRAFVRRQMIWDIQRCSGAEALVHLGYEVRQPARDGASGDP